MRQRNKSWKSKLKQLFGDLVTLFSGNDYEYIKTHHIKGKLRKLFFGLRYLCGDEIDEDKDGGLSKCKGSRADIINDFSK